MLAANTCSFGSLIDQKRTENQMVFWIQSLSLWNIRDDQGNKRERWKHGVIAFWWISSKTKSCEITGSSLQTESFSSSLLQITKIWEIDTYFSFFFWWQRKTRPSGNILCILAQKIGSHAPCTQGSIFRQMFQSFSWIIVALAERMPQ